MIAEEINFDDVAKWLDEYHTLESCAAKKQLQNLIAITCLPLVKRVARNLARRSTDPVEDIIQVGSLGLIKAIYLYNPEISKNFKTYATYLITGEIRHYLRDKASMIKAPRAIQELAYRVNKISIEMAKEFGEKPTETQLANKMDVPVQKVYEAIEVDRRKQTLSLDQLTFQENDDFTNWGDKISDNNYTDHQSLQEDRIMLLDSLSNLEPDLQDIIKMTYFEDLSQVEIAKKLGVSQMQVSRKLKKAISLLYDIVKEKQA